jgi:hypothetical protein
VTGQPVTGQPVTEHPSTGHPSTGHPMTRRVFIGGATGLAGAAVLARVTGDSLTGVSAFGAVATPGYTVVPPNRIPDFSIAAERDTDLLLLDFEFYGFAIETVKSVPTLVPTITGTGTGVVKSNLIIVRLPPQAIGEAVYPVSPSNNTLPVAPLLVDPPPIVSAVAGPSRLCFTLHKGQSIPLPTMTVADLLDWSEWTLVVPPVAQISPPPVGAAHPVPTFPGPFETSIEFPYALFIAPVVWVSGNVILSFSTFFDVRAQPLLNGAITDLWTANLARSGGLLRGGPIPAPSVSAVFASDFVFGGEPTDATPADFIYYGEPPPP